jgi:hypothetical protein
LSSNQSGEHEQEHEQERNGQRGFQNSSRSLRDERSSFSRIRDHRDHAGNGYTRASQLHTWQKDGYAEGGIARNQNHGHGHRNSKSRENRSPSTAEEYENPRTPRGEIRPVFVDPIEDDHEGHEQHFRHRRYEEEDDDDFSADEQGVYQSQGGRVNGSSHDSRYRGTAYASQGQSGKWSTKGSESKKRVVQMKDGTFSSGREDKPVGVRRRSTRGDWVDR